MMIRVCPNVVPTVLFKLIFQSLISSQLFRKLEIELILLEPIHICISYISKFNFYRPVYKRNIKIIEHYLEKNGQTRQKRIFK